MREKIVDTRYQQLRAIRKAAAVAPSIDQRVEALVDTVWANWCDDIDCAMRSGTRWGLGLGALAAFAVVAVLLLVGVL